MMMMMSYAFSCHEEDEMMVGPEILVGRWQTEGKQMIESKYHGGDDGDVERYWGGKEAEDASV